MNKFFNDFSFRVTKRPEFRATEFTVAAMDTVFADLGPRQILPAMLEAVTKQLTDEWLRRHGDKLLDSLAPEAVQEAVEKSLKSRVATAVFGSQATIVPWTPEKK